MILIFIQLKRGIHYAKKEKRRTAQRKYTQKSL